MISEMERTHLGCEAKPDVKRGRKKEEYNGEESRHCQLKKLKAEIISKCMTQTKIDELIFNFIVEDCQSFYVLEQPGFRKLVAGLTEGLRSMDRVTLFTKVDQGFSRMREELMEKLSSIQYVCTTADIWTANSRSFFGMTCHWIDKHSLERKSAALGFARLQGRITHDTIAGRIHDIHVAYNIESKVQTTVTDNGSPFISVFREFAVDSKESDDDIGFYENVSTVLEGEPEQDMLLFLPTVQRCASHTLEQIVTEDFWQAVSQGPMCQLHYSTMAKVYAVWNKCHHLQVGMDSAEEIGKMALVVPAVIRWNVEYCAVQKIVSLSERELTELCARLEVPRMQPEEMAFLKEYVTVFHPLAFALELFQAEQKCYLGLVIPTVLSLKNKLNEQKDSATYLSGVINAIVVAIDLRFQELFASTEAKIATATTPQFRLLWMAASDREEMCAVLATEAAQMDPGTITEPNTSRNSSNTIETEDDFFSYGSVKPAIQIQQRGVMEEIRKYVEGTGKSLECLQDFPRMKQLFLKYNTTLPSTAPIQRLFSQKGNLVTSQRNFLTDDYFERIQLLRYNSNVCTLVTE
ncbi:putative AC9 transposase [Dissostichus eleginoides]|uniref:AC9 transposase n=1 Tax=Dissostichus eleginoides TaxID=100907 RepID=A0AAD9B6S5_DISEL|nr:putative AC9 transposase [Dissostichus eleginoides]